LSASEKTIIDRTPSNCRIEPCRVQLTEVERLISAFLAHTSAIM
jgi:hypothetical protein